MGADVKIEYGSIMAEAKHLRGSHIYLDVVSVGATINIMMAASMAEGNTVIENAAQGTPRGRRGELPEQHGREHQGRRY